MKDLLGCLHWSLSKLLSHHGKAIPSLHASALHFESKEIITKINDFQVSSTHAVYILKSTFTPAKVEDL